MQPWEQRPTEPTKWFERMTRLRLMNASERSIDAAFHAEYAEKSAKGSNKEQKGAPKRANGHWYENAKKWEWDARIEAWDRHWQAQENLRMETEKAEREAQARALFEAKRLKAREDRISALDAAKTPFYRMIANMGLAFKDMDLSKIGPAHLAALASFGRFIFEQERIEYGEITSRVDLTSDGKELKALTADKLAAIDRQVNQELEEFDKLFYGGNGNGNGHG